MRLTNKRRLAYLLYGLGGAAFLYYFVLEMDGSVRLDPLDRILLLGVGCACLYLAGRTLCCTVDAQRAAVVMRGTFRALFLVYLLLVLTFTLFDDAFGRGSGAFTLWGIPDWADVQERVNFIPFRTIRLYLRSVLNGRVSVRSFMLNIVGNLLAFMPMGLFLPLLFERCRKRPVFFLCVSGTVCLIEGMQLLSRRGSCDVDDLLLNVTGAVLLFELLRLRPVRRVVERLTLQTL